ncbi:GumC family protein [Leptolyngbya sp. AN02str]|uniref:GumC family protein n=1 Tax=Leptolyngbya sp. AN02str TaxID=3423363 RepID=UPI003D3223B0
MDKISSLSSTFKRRLWVALATFTSVVGAASVFLLTATPRYQTAVRLLIDEQKTSVSELGRALSEVPNATPGGASPVATQAELVKSQRILQKALDRVRLQDPSGAAEAYPSPGELGSRVEVKIVPATNLLELSYENENPEFAAKVLNAIAEAMVEENSEAIRQEASSVREFLEKTIPEQEARLTEAERAEQQFRQANGLVAAEVQASTLVQNLAAVEDELRATIAQIQQANTRDGQLQQITGVGSPDSGYAAVRAGQDESLRDLRTRLAELESQIIDSQSRLGDQHPDLLALLDQRDQLQQYYEAQFANTVGGQAVPSDVAATDEVSRELISQYITGTVERNALTSKLAALQTNRQSLQARLTQLPAQQQRLAALVRRTEEEEASLKLLQNNLEQARIAEAQLISNVRIVDPAVAPSTPASPKAPVVLVMAIAAGSVLAVGAVLLLELLDNTIHSTDDPQELFNVPVMGTLPKVVSIRNFADLERFLDDSRQVEPYRRLLKSLEHRYDSPLNVLLISSTFRGEGKSNLAARLAAVSAMASRRTLLVDADLHHPSLHAMFNAESQPGIAEVTEGSIPLYKAIQSTGIDNLSLLSCGRLLTRPSMALEAPSMKKLVAKVAGYYDLVVIDTAPAGQNADALTLNQYTDGFLMVVRPEHTPRDAVQRAVTDLQNGGSDITGIILNETSDLPIAMSEPRTDFRPPSQTPVRPVSNGQSVSRVSHNKRAHSG